MPTKLRRRRNELYISHGNGSSLSTIALNLPAISAFICAPPGIVGSVAFACNPIRREEGAEKS